MKILDWNIGCYFFAKYFKKAGYKYRGNIVENEYFNPKINGNIVSSFFTSQDPDIIFLQEIFDPTDLGSISILTNYPFKKLIHSWYHKHCILIASKNEFETVQIGEFYIIKQNNLNFIPIHLNSFSSKIRLSESKIISGMSENIENTIILGDTNIWNRGNFFAFKNDKSAYTNFTRKFIDATKNILSTTTIGLGLDKVFVSKNLKCVNVSSPKIRGKFMDHYPIVFEIKN